MWEYKEEAYKETENKSDMIKFLNKQGKDGWELVNLAKPDRSCGFVPYWGMIFKRKCAE